MRLFARRPSPAMVVAVVALSFALAGSAVAGTASVSGKLTKEESKQVKKIAKKQANKQIKKKAPGLSVAKATNADRLGGVAAARYQQALYAVVDDPGTGGTVTLVRGKGAVSAELAATAHYDVGFDRDVTGCAYVATVGSPDDILGPNGIAVVASDPTNPNGVRVRITALNGTLLRTDFHLQVAC